MKYKIIKHNEDLGGDNDYFVRDFTLEDENGNKFYGVDIYTDGKLIHPKGVDETRESWRAWFDTFVGRTIEVENLSPRGYFTQGEIKLLD